MKTQEAYERIREFFSRPDAQLAKRGDGGMPACFYRGDSNPASPLRCAVGCLIPDELYVPELDEGLGVVEIRDAAVTDGDEAARALAEFFEAGTSGAEADDLWAFLAEAQNAHDSSGDTEEFVKMLNSIAKSHNLEVKAG